MAKDKRHSIRHNSFSISNLKHTPGCSTSCTLNPFSCGFLDISPVQLGKKPEWNKEQRRYVYVPNIINTQICKRPDGPKMQGGK